MDLSKIGKCELCVLAKQVRARKIEIGEKAINTGTWNQELMDEYEACASSLENTRDAIHRFESRKYAPTRNLQELDCCEGQTEEEAKIWQKYDEEMIQEAMRLIGWNP